MQGSNNWAQLPTCDYLGKTTQNLYFFAASGYYAPANGNALYYGTVDASTQKVKTFHIDSSEPTINAVTSGDLNGDGLADVISVDQFGGSASIGVRLAHPDGSLDPAVAYPITGSTDEAAVVDDFNGDGKLDVAVAVSDSSNNTESIAILEGKGDGTLGSPLITSAPNQGQKIANLISVNLRGMGQDIVASNGLVLLNDGHGNFSASSTPAFPPRSATSEFGPNLASGDFNGDGHQDVAVNTGEQVLIYLGNGDGTFTPGKAYAAINDVGYVTVTDLDGDGNADIYIGLAQGGFFGGDQFEIGNSYALMGNGDGTFRGAPVAPAVYNGFNLADLNGDKIRDMVAASGTAFIPELGNADGTFKAGQALNVPTFDDNGTPITVTSTAGQPYALADLNGDGFPDLIWVPTGLLDRSTQRGFYLIALNKGDGSFGTPAVYILPSTVGGTDFTFNEQATVVQAADLNHDGKQDLIFTFSDNDYQTQSYRQGFLILLGKGDGTFTTGTPVLTYNSTTARTLSPATIAAITDINGDGAPDMFVVNPLTETSTGTTTEWQLYINKGDGTFDAPTMPDLGSNPLPGQQYEKTPIAIVDMNGDGHLDVVSIGVDSTGRTGSLVISLGKGDGTFTQASTTALTNFASGGFSDLAVADFNGDGKNDVAFPSINGGGIFPGNGDGTVQVYTDVNGGTFPAQQIQLLTYGFTTAADMNGDGLPDLLVGDTVLLNLGKNVPSGGGGGGQTSSTTTIAASATSIATGAQETLTATVAAPAGSTALPTGTVNFLDGTTSLGTGTLDSKAAGTFSTTSLIAGSHSITAAYSGDATYAASTSAAITVTVTTPPPVPADYAVALTPASGTASGMAVATTTLTVTPSNGFSSAVTFSCSGLPSGYSCSFSPTTVTPHGAAATTAVSFGTTQTAAVNDLPATRNGIAISLAGTGIAGWLFVGLGRRRRWLLRSALVVLAAGLAAGLGGVSGCGSSSSKTQTSSVTITATAGSLSHTATFTLTTK